MAAGSVGLSWGAAEGAVSLFCLAPRLRSSGERRRFLDACLLAAAVHAPAQVLELQAALRGVWGGARPPQGLAAQWLRQRVAWYRRADREHAAAQVVRLREEKRRRREAHAARALELRAATLLRPEVHEHPERQQHDEGREQAEEQLKEEEEEEGAQRQGLQGGEGPGLVDGQQRQDDGPDGVAQAPERASGILEGGDAESSSLRSQGLAAFPDLTLDGIVVRAPPLRSKRSRALRVGRSCS